MDGKKKILIFTPFYYPHLGGVERFSSNMAESLAHDFGYEVKMVTFNTENCLEKEILDGIPVYRLPSFKVLNGRYPVPKLSPKLFKLFSELMGEDADYFIVNTRFFFSSLVGVLLAKLKAKPSILIEHGSGHFELSNRLSTAIGEIYEHVISKLTGACCDLAFAVSKGSGRWLGHFHIEATDIVHTSVDVSKREMKGEDLASELGIDDDHLVISNVGRVIKEKGIRELLEAFSTLSMKHENLCLVIAGEGEYLNEIKSGYGDMNNVIFAGRLEPRDVYKLLAITTIFVHPSNYPEGLPTVILEAGMHGCAIVATAQGGTEEVVPDDRYGILIERGSAELIHVAVDQLLLDENKRETMARNIRDRITRHFETKACIGRLVQHLRKFESG